MVKLLAEAVLAIIMDRTKAVFFMAQILKAKMNG